MLIVWGKKIVRRDRTRTLHFCPVCREVCGGRVVTVLRVPHLYLIQIGSGERVLDELVCSQCGSVFGFSDLVPHLDSDAAILRLRAEAESAVRARKIEPTVRARFIREAIACLNYEFEREKSSGSSESVSVVIGLLFAISFIGALFGWLSYAATAHPVDQAALLPWCVGCSVGLVIFGAASAHRFRNVGKTIVRQRMLSRIARSLVPIDPSPIEVENALRELRSEGKAIARQIESGQLLNAVDLARLHR